MAALPIPVPPAPFGPTKFPAGDLDADAYKDPGSTPVQRCYASDKDPGTHAYKRSVHCYISKPNFVIGKNWTQSPDVYKIPDDQCAPSPNAYRPDTGEPVSYSGTWPVDHYEYSVKPCEVAYSVGEWSTRQTQPSNLV